MFKQLSSRIDGTRRLVLGGLVALAAFTAGAGADAVLSSAYAQSADVTITYKNRQFQPASVSAPANTALTLRIRNGDPKAIEFESNSLRVEKIIAANSEGVIKLRPLQPGSYEFFDEFNESARGTLVIK